MPGKTSTLPADHPQQPRQSSRTGMQWMLSQSLEEELPRRPSFTLLDWICYHSTKQMARMNLPIARVPATSRPPAGVGSQTSAFSYCHDER